MQYLITLTFIVISVWVMPAATEPDLDKLYGKDNILFYNDNNMCVIVFIFSKFNSDTIL